MSIFHINKLAIALLMATPSMALAQTQPSIASFEAMDRECTAFLQKMPPTLQGRQAQAVRQAMEGRSDALQQIRNSRNVPPQLPAELDTAYVRTDLCVFTPQSCAINPRPVVLYLHGGGWTFGSINSCARFCAALALQGNCIVAALNYRLSPEHPYPAPLNDCRDALTYIKSHTIAWHGDSTRVFVIGDSAGGNLALALGMSESGISGVMPIYPVTALYPIDSPSWKTYAQGYGNDAELLQTFFKAYAHGHEQEALVSVADAPDSLLLRLPRTLVLSAGRDILLDQATSFVSRLKQLGHKQAQQIVFPTATHLFITVDGQPTALAEAVKLAAEFIQ